MIVCSKPICSCLKTPYIAFQEPDELLVPVYAGCKIVSEKAHFSLFQTDQVGQNQLKTHSYAYNFKPNVDWA